MRGLRIPSLQTVADRGEAVLECLLLAVVAFRALFFLGYSLYALLFPFPIDYDEGVDLHSSLLLARGEAVYPPLEAGRFVSSVYTPLFYLLSAPWLGWWGPTLVPGRLIALGSSLGAAALLGATVCHLGAGPRIAAIAGLMPLSLGTVVLWSTFAKPDTLSLFLGLLTCYWCLRFAERPEVYLAPFWFALAFFAKQNVVLLAGMGLAFLFLRNPRRGLLVGVAALGATAGAVLLLNGLTHGGFLLHTFEMLRFPWLLSRLWALLGPVPVLFPFLALAVLISLGVHLRRRAWFVPLLFLGGLGVLASGARVGTTWGFQLPLMFAMALAAGLLLGQKGLPRTLRLGLGALLLCQMILLPDPLRFYRSPLLPSRERKAEMARACALLRQTPPPVLSDDVGLLLLCGHEPPYDDPFLMAQMARLGRWDQGVLCREVEAEHFSLIILTDRLEESPEGEEWMRWTVPVLSRVRAHYRLEARYDDFYFYRPVGSPSEHMVGSAEGGP
ncbi:MAG: ArnT family glycosyltransferase [Chloroflexia bacterium]